MINKQIITIQNMIDMAMEEGAACARLWSQGKYDSYYLKITDEGNWYFVDTKDHLIDEEDARRLLDCYQIGYID